MGLQQGGRMYNTTDSSWSFVFSATGTKYTSWVDVALMDELITFLEATWANQSGATLDVSLEIKNPRTTTAFDPSSAHTQLTDTGSNHKAHSAFGSKIRMKLVAGGTFGGSETITATLDYAAKSA